MYYIVYKTTNLINKKEYIGVHGTSNYNIFDQYLGCGCYSNKPSSFNQPTSSIFPRAVKKYGPENFKREVLFVYPYTEEGEQLAYDKEAELVNAEWVKSDKNYNIALGGKNGRVKDQNKKVRQYDLQGNYIKTWNSIKEAMEIYPGHIAEVCRRTRITASEYQWRFDSENLDKLDPVCLQKKTVYQFDLQGNLLKTWRSVNEAASQFDNVASAKTLIKKVCGGLAVSAKGYFWSYKCKFMYKSNFKQMALACYTEEGVFIKSFTNVEEVCKELKITDFSGLKAAITGQHKFFKGFRWRYFYGNTQNIKAIKHN